MAENVDQFGDEVEYTTEFHTENPPDEVPEDWGGGAITDSNDDDPEVGHVEPEDDSDAGEDDDAF